MKSIICIFVICLTTSIEFAVCATKDGIVGLQQDDLPNHQVEVGSQTQVLEAISVNQLGQDYVRGKRVEVPPQAQSIPMSQTIHDFVDARMEEIVQEHEAIGGNLVVGCVGHD
jgi:hypothetical protein